MHKKEHRHFWQVLLQRVEAVTVICCVLDSIMRADLENVNQHADLLEDGRALRREVRVREGILTAAVSEVEVKVAKETGRGFVHALVWRGRWCRPAVEDGC